MAKKFPGGGGATKKTENSTNNPLPGGRQWKKDQKIAKKDRKLALKPLSTISVPSIKIQGGGARHSPFLSPVADAHACSIMKIIYFIKLHE